MKEERLTNWHRRCCGWLETGVSVLHMCNKQRRMGVSLWTGIFSSLLLRTQKKKKRVSLFVSHTFRFFPLCWSEQELVVRYRPDNELWSSSVLNYSYYYLYMVKNLVWKKCVFINFVLKWIFVSENGRKQLDIKMLKQTEGQRADGEFTNSTLIAEIHFHNYLKSFDTVKVYKTIFDCLRWEWSSSFFTIYSYLNENFCK